jgi:hypothetical protein
MSTDVSEERTASSFRGEKYQKQACGKPCPLIGGVLLGLLFDLQDREIGFSETSVDVYRIT